MEQKGELWKCSYLNFEKPLWKAQMPIFAI